MDPREVEFHRALVALATMCRFQLTPEVVAMYDRVIQQIGYEPGTRAIVRIFASRKANDPFPALSEIVSMTQQSDEPAMTAQECANRIWKAVGEFGAYQRTECENAVNSLCNEVIDQVDWSWLCSLESSEGNTAKAQMRQAAQAIIDRRKQEQIDELLKKVPQLGYEAKKLT